MPTIGGHIFSDEVFPWADRPVGEIPATLQIQDMIARGERCAVFIDHISVFSTGLLLRVEGRLRETEANIKTVMPEGRHPLTSMPAVKVRYSDGRSAEAQGHAPPPVTPVRDSRSSEPVLSVRGIHIQDALHSSFSCWLHPLPKQGSLSVGVEWKAFGLPFHEWHIPAADIEECRARVSEIWAR